MTTYDPAPPEPLTASGRRLLDSTDLELLLGSAIMADLRRAILAIEAEAATLDRERTRETPPEPDLEGLRRYEARSE